MLTLLAVAFVFGLVFNATPGAVFALALAAARDLLLHRPAGAAPTTLQQGTAWQP